MYTTICRKAEGLSVVEDDGKHELGEHQDQRPENKRPALDAAGKAEILGLQIGKVAETDQAVFTARTDRHGKAAMDTCRLAGPLLQFNFLIALRHNDYLL